MLGMKDILHSSLQFSDSKYRFLELREQREMMVDRRAPVEPEVETLSADDVFRALPVDEVINLTSQLWALNLGKGSFVNQRMTESFQEAADLLLRVEYIC